MKLYSYAFIGIALLAATLPTQATVYFQNDGNTSGWGNTSTQNGGVIQYVSSPSFNGSGGSLESTCTFQGANGTKYHSEPTAYGNWNSGTTYFGYALYLPTSWQFSGSPQRHVTEQYGTRNPGGSVIVPDYYQAWVGGGNANLMQFSRVSGSSSDENTGTMTAGTWHTIVTKMTYGSSGNITVWFDGNQAWSISGTINGGGGGNPQALYAVGLYEADWANGNPYQQQRSVYNAKITIASSYNEANPGSVGGGGGGSFSGNYEIQSVVSGQAVNVSGDSTTNGAAVIQWAYSGSNGQKWTFVPTSNGYYQIKNMNSGLDLVVQGASTANGALTVQWSFGSSGDDQWQPVQNSDGTYTFHNLHSGLVLDDPASSTTQGTQYDQWASNGGANQKFNLISR